LHRDPIEDRKGALLKSLRKADYGIFSNDHVEGEAAIVFQHACKLGLEGIVSKRRGSPYVSGRSPHCLKLKNPNGAAVKREAEEEWAKPPWKPVNRIKLLIETGQFWNRLPIALFYVGDSGITNGKRSLSLASSFYADQVR